MQQTHVGDVSGKTGDVAEVFTMARADPYRGDGPCQARSGRRSLTRPGVQCTRLTRRAFASSPNCTVDWFAAYLAGAVLLLLPARSFDACTPW
jgi:hypothetical protein